MNRKKGEVWEENNRLIELFKTKIWLSKNISKRNYAKYSKTDNLILILLSSYPSIFLSFYLLILLSSYPTLCLSTIYKTKKTHTNIRKIERFINSTFIVINSCIAIIFLISLRFDNSYY